MMETHTRQHISLWQWIQMSKILINMIRIHGGLSMRQFMHLILERLNYFLKCFLITVKIIQMSNKIFHPKSRKMSKITLEESFYAKVVMICPKILVQKKKWVKILKTTCFKEIMNTKTLFLSCYWNSLL